MLTRSRRNGISLLELLVATVVLMTTMTLATTMSFRTQRIWQDVRQHRIAMNELSNQLERLTQMTPDSLAGELSQLKPSALCAESLPQPQLAAATAEGDLGTRITLSLDWKRRIKAKPLTLSGWLNPSPESNAKQETP